MGLKIKRNAFERFLGTVVRADGRLEAAKGNLQNDFLYLRWILEDRNARLKNQAFIDKMRRRYGEGKRSFYYRFASTQTQKGYDVWWQGVGSLIKYYQAKGLVGRDGISPESLEKLVSPE